eukprot:g6561.t1
MQWGEIKQYKGTITPGFEIAQQLRFATTDVAKIPFKPWKSGSSWQYCTQKKFVGDGYALMKQISWTKFFHLSIYPSSAAFEDMEKQICNPRTHQFGWVASKKCQCGKTFRVSTSNQVDCVQCLQREQAFLVKEIKKLQENAKKHDETIRSAQQELKILKRKHTLIQDNETKLQSDFQIVRKKYSKVHTDYKEVTEKLAKHAEKLDMQWGKIKQYEETITTGAQIAKELNKRNKNLVQMTQQMGTSQTFQTKILKKMSEINKSVSDFANSLDKIEKAQDESNKRLCENKLGYTNLNEKIEMLVQSNNNFKKLLIDQILSDTHRLFRCIFGTINPKNRNIISNVIQNNVREWPKNLGLSLKSLGIPIGTKLSIANFSNLMQSLGNFTNIIAFTSFGQYMNSETELVSVTHMSSEEIYSIICNYADDNDNEERKIAESVLNSWFKISARTMKHNVVNHMFRNGLLNMYKHITHIKLTLQNTTHSLMFGITLYTESYTKKNGKMVLDASLRESV